MTLPSFPPGPGLGGAILVYTSPHLVDVEKWIQVRFPKSRKRRIRNKWAWRSENWAHPPLDRFLLIDGKVYCHPELVPMLRAKLPGVFLFI